MSIRAALPLPRLPAWVVATAALSFAPFAMSAIDLQSLWDFARPAVSEQRFRDLLGTASPDDAATLRTQIARTFGLRRDFATARRLLDEVEPLLPGLGAEPRVRFHLERGRTWASATHRTGEITPEARSAARADYLKAHELARAAGLDALAVDALHMMPFVETDAAAGLAWNEKALALALVSPDPAARRWEASLRNNIGYSLHQMGRLEEALAAFRANVAATESLGHPGRIRIAWWMVAWTLRGLGRVDEALAIQQRLERENAAAGEPDPYVFEELELLHRARGEETEAKRYAALRAAPAR